MSKNPKRRAVPLDWELVCRRLEELAGINDLPSGEALWRAGQEHSLRWIARQLRTQSGVLVADEVGLGKTRLAVALAVCVAASGGRVAVLIPPGLAYQWKDEELPLLLRHLDLLQPAWLKHRQQQPTTRFLRTYADLFAGDGTYPLAQPGTILFISHGFGLPAVGKVSRDELWALPYLAKAAAGLSAWGSSKLATSDKQSGQRQRAAARYAAESCHSKVRKDLSRLIHGRPSPTIFKDREVSTLFEHLIGTLIGDIDLMVIDEAHKARAGADVTAVEQSKQTRLASRLTKLVDHILLRPGCIAATMKRMALTATPMELGAQQWGSMFSRLGIEFNEVQRLNNVVMSFEQAVQGLRSGSVEELQRLATCASAYQAALRPIVTRRLWRDHPTVQRYAQTIGQARSAHPHRKYRVHPLTLVQLSEAERQRLALAEALAAAARGSNASHDAKTAGMRFSQALPPMPEAAQDPFDEVRSVASLRPGRKPKVAPAPSGFGQAQALKADEGRRQRRAFWTKTIAEADAAQLGHVASDARWALQWHPRVRSAIDLVESLTGNGDKVLLFAEFLASLHALDRALNIRHYLRHMQQDQPIPLPQGVRSSDPDLRRWLQDPTFGLADITSAEFQARAEAFSKSYERDRSHLRESCQRVLSEDGIDWFLSAKQSSVLTTWLVQQLCTAELLWQQDDNVAIAREVRLRLASLRDPDPPPPAACLETDDIEKAGLADVEEPQARAMAWPAIVEQLKDELQRGEGTNEYVFRMSPFSQLMTGNTKTATRRARQGAFNHAQLNPRVLLGQADVMSEGLNLHRACRKVVLFHLDWNPGRIEQQIGRIDRQDSEWMRLCDDALAKGDTPLPLEVYTVSVQGTYDDMRTQVVEARRRQLRAQLFGEIVPVEILEKLPLDAQAAIALIDIDFRPGLGALPT